MKMKLKNYQPTVCNYCGTRSNGQPNEDGCHVCLKGTMFPQKNHLT